MAGQRSIVMGKTRSNYLPPSKLPGQSLPWLQRLRSLSLARWQASGFPSTQNEQWRHTDMTAIEKLSFTPATVATPPNPQQLAQFTLPNANTAVLVDGHFCRASSKLDNLAAGVTVTSMADALRECPELLAKYLGTAANYHNHNFIAFNNASFGDGVLVHIPAGVQLDNPIQLLHLNQDKCISTCRNLLLLDDNASATISETFSGSDSYHTNTVSEVFLADHAKLCLNKLQSETLHAYHFGGIYARQGVGSELQHHNFAFGGLLSRTELHTDLAQYASCDFNGLYFGEGRQHLDNHTRINHSHPNSSSRQLYKGILKQRATGVFQGRIVVAQNAQKTNANMHNHNLLLSPDAKAYTQPQLEIYADDVKCAHGVTVGQLQEDSIFYLKSRGIDLVTAENILTLAFAQQMTDKINCPSLQTQILDQLLQHFPQEITQQQK